MQANGDNPHGPSQNGHNVPSDHGRNGDGRDAKGRFGPKNNCGQGGDTTPGREYRKAFMKALEDGDVENVTRSMVGKALDGDVPAARLIFEYAMGKPKETVEVLGAESFKDVVMGMASSRFRDMETANGHDGSAQ